MTPVLHAVPDRAGLACVGALIAHAFDHLDANHYLVPDPRRRQTVMTSYFTLLAEHAAAGAGQVWSTAAGDAAAVLFDRTHPTTPADLTTPERLLEHGRQERLDAAISADAPRFAALDAALEAHHPTEPHWHLAFLAVHPDRQHRGLGTALLHHIHQQLNGQPAYLEATNTDNARLYQRHGYHPLDPATITVGNPPGPHATFWRMWRPKNPCLAGAATRADQPQQQQVPHPKRGTADRT